MTVLALRLAARSNGVSRAAWRGQPRDVDRPLAGRAGGRGADRPRHQRRAFPQSWISHEMNRALRPLPRPEWREEPADEDVWTASSASRRGIVAHARAPARAPGGASRAGACRTQLDAAARRTRRSTPPTRCSIRDALTIGFARRFATYKRATLLLRDPDRLARILTNPRRPVQLIFAGKAHPRDDAGKELIRRSCSLARRTRLPAADRVPGGLRHGGRALPGAGRRRLAEHAAAAPRGQRHQRHEGGRQRRAQPSTLDGWWDEAWDAQDQPTPIGWAIGEPGGTPTRTSRTPSTPRHSTPRWSARSCPASTSVGQMACRGAGWR